MLPARLLAAVLCSACLSGFARSWKRWFTAGKVREAVKILGTDLNGAIGVSFKRNPAEFKVVSKTLIEALVPTGATIGYVTVSGPGGTLQSNVKFLVRP